MHVPHGEITRISNWGVPLCKRDVQSFIGVLNFHRDHIPKFALVQNPCVMLWDRQLRSVGYRAGECI